MRLEHRKPERPSRSTLAKYSTPVLLQGCLPTEPTCSLDTAGFVRHIPYPLTTLTGEGKAAILARRGLASSGLHERLSVTRNHDWSTARKTDGQASQPGDGGRRWRGLFGCRAAFNLCVAR